MSPIEFGRYRVLAEIGHGGTADVYLASTGGAAGATFNRLLVIKCLRRTPGDSSEFAMLLDEARIAARLSHPNVIQTLEVGKVRGRYFLAMEFLDGQSLDRIRRRAREASLPIPIAMQYRVLCSVLGGLHHAHELRDYDGTHLGVVHRDVTPHNIFVTYEGQVKLVD